MFTNPNAVVVYDIRHTPWTIANIRTYDQIGALRSPIPGQIRDQVRDHVWDRITNIVWVEVKHQVMKDLDDAT